MSLYSKKYHPGRLSFIEKDYPQPVRKTDGELCLALMSGPDKDQYSVPWIEHGNNKQIALNVVITNTKLLTGKWLQSYFERAGRSRIDAWRI